MPMSEDAKTPRRQRARMVRRERPSNRPDSKVRTTVTFDRAVWVRIGVMADLQGMDRASLINATMDQATRSIVISVRDRDGAGERERPAEAGLRSAHQDPRDVS
jgi:hypothetical protein